MSSIGSISAGLPIGAMSWIAPTTATKPTATPLPVQPVPSSTVPGSSSGVSYQDLQKQIVAAIKDAVAKLDPNASPRGVKDTIQGAVDSVLQKNGIDPAKAMHGHHRHGGVGAASASGAAQDSAMLDQLLKIVGNGSASDPDGDGDGQGSASSAITGIGANSPASSMFGASSTGSSDPIGTLLQTFLKNSMPTGSLFSATA